MNYRYYYEYLQLHYKYVTDELGIVSDTEEIVQCYLNAIANSSVLKEPNTLAVYKELSADYSILLATNGVAQVQERRISEFAPYTHRVYISEEMGGIKPAKEYFDYILEDLYNKIQIHDFIVKSILFARKMFDDRRFYYE